MLDCDRKLRVILLDDQPIVLSGVSMLLGALGHQVTQASRGEEVVERFQNGERFDVAILEMTVEAGLGGSEIAADLLQIDPDVKLIVSSGYGISDVISDCQQFGFHGALPKPFSMAELKLAIDSVMQVDKCAE